MLGMSTALSLAIGLEMLIYLAVAGAAMVLFWVDDRGRARAAAALTRSRWAAATALAFLLFASNDNRHAVCDALSPVWLSDALLGGALMLRPRLAVAGRLEAAAGAGGRGRG